MAMLSIRVMCKSVHLKDGPTYNRNPRANFVKPTHQKRVSYPVVKSQYKFLSAWESDAGQKITGKLFFEKLPSLPKLLFPTILYFSCKSIKTRADHFS